MYPQASATPSPLVQTPPVGLPDFREPPHPQKPTTLLAVTNHEEDLDLLAQNFRETNWRLGRAKSYREAVMILCQERMPVIISQCCLPDGSWKDILSRMVDLPDAPVLIVASTEPVDYLCAEVINLGGIRRSDHSIRSARIGLGGWLYLATLGK